MMKLWAVGELGVFKEQNSKQSRQRVVLDGRGMVCVGQVIMLPDTQTMNLTIYNQD